MNRKEFINKGFSLLMIGSLSAICLPSFGNDGNKTYKVIAKRCDGCGHCLRACREKALRKNGNVAVIDKEKCRGCGDCLRFCRRQAIVLEANQ